MTLKTVLLRRFRRADLDAVTRIERACFRRDAYPAELFLDYFERSPGVFLVAAAGDDLAGYVLAEIFRGRAEIVSVAVSAVYRRSGVAVALMRGAFRRLRLRGAGSVTLTVKVTNAGAIRLYEGLGFARRRRMHGYYEDGRDGWRMTRAL